MVQLQQIEDIRKEPLIKKKWGFVRSKPSAYADGILVTGANSFIGAHVVSLLQKKWQGQIHLLLRAATKAEAIGKMEKAFASWQTGKFDHQKFFIHLGDICQPMMGLSSTEYKSLKSSVGFVLHLAMNPLYHLPYAHFKRLWMPELSRMVSFCGHKEFPKSLHYPSSFNANFFTTEDDFQQLNANAWQSGYAGFKWVAGKTLQNAFNQNLRGCLYDIPLVLGSEDKGICPSHYSIWLIIDIFLKTGFYIDFKFKIIPVDVLSEIIVSNLLADKNNESIQFIRPALDEPVSHRQFRNTVANILGLQPSTPETLREACYNKQKFDFMFPSNFYSLLDKVNALPAILPKSFNKQTLPSTQMVFLSNLNRILSHNENAKQIILKTKILSR